MICLEKERLQKRYRTAVDTYGQVVNAGLAGGEITRHASEECQMTLEALLKHLQAHACGPPGKDESWTSLPAQEM